MDTGCDWRLQSDWYSPTRLHHSPVEFDFPGDRFIPNRSLMDLDQVHSVLTNRTSRTPSNSIGQKLENMKLNEEGRPFQMLVFRGSPKSSRKLKRSIDEKRRSDENICCIKPLRLYPTRESFILDAPNLRDDFYVNVLDWGKTNILAVGLDSNIYLRNAHTCKVEVIKNKSNIIYPSSVSWADDGKTVAVGYSCSRLELYDAQTLKLLRCFDHHREKVGSLAWNGHILTSGSRFGDIINHDVRSKNDVACYSKVHKQEVCGLKWSITGNILASGGNDNIVNLWDARQMSSMKGLYKLKDHCAGVRALAWSPHNHNLLASGGGSNDGSLKIWDVRKGTCIQSIPTKAQVCALLWNRHHNEILSGHGFGYAYGNECANSICLWKYPYMSKVVDLKKHDSRVLHLSQSPDGVTVVSAGSEEVLRFWKLFGPAMDIKHKISYLDGLLSLKTSPLR